MCAYKAVCGCVCMCLCCCARMHACVCMWVCASACVHGGVHVSMCVRIFSTFNFFLGKALEAGCWAGGTMNWVDDCASSNQTCVD